MDRQTAQQALASPHPGTAGHPLVPTPLGLALTAVILAPGEEGLLEQLPLQLVDKDGSGLGGDAVVREDTVLGEGGPGPPQGHGCSQAWGWSRGWGTRLLPASVSPFPRDPR